MRAQLAIGLLQPESDTGRFHLSFKPDLPIRFRDELTRDDDSTDELSGLMALPGTDPKDLGDRAIAIEYIRRDQVAKQGALQTSIATLLTPAQMALVQSLIASSTLLPVAADAKCAYLVQSQVVGGDFSARRQNRIADLNQQIQISPSDPTVLGLAYLEIANINKDLTAGAANLSATVKAQLTPEQQAKLKGLQDAQDLQDMGLIFNAVSCNIAVLPVGSAGLVTGNLSFCQL